MITDEQIANVIGCPFNETSDYDEVDIRRVAFYAHFEGQREATKLWAWWKDGTQYVGTTGHTLNQALDLIAEEQYKLLGDIEG